MPSLKVPCPSCEAPVLIKNPNLVGAKVECPKCKYRFKVEEPPAAAAGDPAKPGEVKDAKPDDKAKTKTPGNKKKLIQIGAGAGALVLLVGVGIVAFGGKKEPASTTGTPKPPTRTNTPTNPDGSNPDDSKDAKKPADPPKPAVEFSKRVTSNLLPGQTTAVYRFNMRQVREAPVHTALVDTKVSELFQSSMGFPVDDVETYIHCFVGDGREPFGVIKLNRPTKPADTVAKMALPPSPKTVKGQSLYPLGPNRFIGAVTHALAMRSLLGDVFKTVPVGQPAGATDRPMGVCVYDTQHILLGDYAVLERFLSELDAGGYPPFKSALLSAGEPAPQPPAPGSPPGTPPGTQPAGPPKGPGTPPGTPPGAPPKTPGGPVPPKTPAAEPTPPPKPAPEAADKTYTSINEYRSLELPLKKALDDMESDRYLAPLFVYAEKFVPRLYDLSLMKKEYGALASVLRPIVARVKYLSANVLLFSQQRLIANLRISFGSTEESRSVAREQLSPTLPLLTEMLGKYLSSSKAERVEFRDYTVASSSGGSAGGAGLPPNTGTPGELGRPPLAGPGSGGPGSGPIGGGSGLSPGGPKPLPGMSGGPGPGGPPTAGPGSGGPGSGYGFGPGQGPGGGGPGMQPGFPKPPGMPGSGGPGGPGGPGPATPPAAPDAYPSHVDLGQSATDLLIRIDLNWSEAVFRDTIAPRLVSVANQIRGQMALFSSDTSWATLAAAGPKALAAQKAFPRGTVARGVTDPERLGLDYPPVQRVSFFYDLLPYLGRDQLAATINPKVAWFDERNMPVPGQDRAGAWIPELLVPYYPQSAWRATSPYAPDHTLGATNYVAVAGRGADVARANPNDPAFKSRVGITGYGWGSKAEEVTDGLSNTIYLMQTPPGLQQPWIAGGGATVRGLDETDPMAAFTYTHPDGKGGSKPGTYALMADGSVRWIPANIDPKVLLALSTRAGNDGADLAGLDDAAPKVELKTEMKAELKAEVKVEPKPEEKKPEEKKPDGKKQPAAQLEVAPPPRDKK
jgi:hypothetical protein